MASVASQSEAKVKLSDAVVSQKRRPYSVKLQEREARGWRNNEQHSSYLRALSDAVLPSLRVWLADRKR